MDTSTNPDESVFQVLEGGNPIGFASDGWLTPTSYVWISTQAYTPGNTIQLTMTAPTPTIRSAWRFIAPAPQGPFLGIAP